MISNALDKILNILVPIMRKIWSWFWILILISVGFGIIKLSTRGIFGGESEGIVKYDDCRQVITINEGDWKTYQNKFTCNILKSNSGKVIGGTCVHVDTQAGICTTALVYKKKPDINCGANSHPDMDDLCYCDWGYHVDPSNNKLCAKDSPTPFPTLDPGYIPGLFSPTPIPTQTQKTTGSGMFAPLVLSEQKNNLLNAKI